MGFISTDLSRFGQVTSPGINLPGNGGGFGGLIGLGRDIAGIISGFREQQLPGGAPPQVGGARPSTPLPGIGAVTMEGACAPPFNFSRCGTGVRAVAQVHARANPISGKLQWFGPGKIRFVPNRGTRRRRCPR